ncbi:discoidin domain-containing protein [Streptomyces sp. NBC_01244]|uniref:discoidin domain-containing protein n=1 Tax=Streptomyces sp. NBC_01244 TaxID=2903797 RepID=UPI002E14A7FD|nr:discoidin domain-containing protein [Streptomyces sp. NBC_01244]
MRRRGTVLLLLSGLLSASLITLPQARAADGLVSTGKPTTASSQETGAFPASLAVDADTGTRWASAEGVDPQWIRIDLGTTHTISRVKLNWEAAYAKTYKIQTSNDGTNWTDIHSTSTGNGATDDLTLTGTGRHIRMHGTARGTAYGYSLWEFEVYGAPAGAGGPVVDVSTAAQLQGALAAAQPGQTIRLAAGEYRGAFVTRRAGTAAAPVTLTGPAAAVLVNDGPSGTAPACPAPGGGWDPGYGLWLYDAPYWNLTGFTVKDSKKGVVLDNSHHVTLDGLSVHHVEDEAVHFRRSSSDGVIRNSTITHTGLVQPGYGEAVYIGSAGSNWGCHGNQGGVDRSDRVQVLNNRIGPNVAAEHIDIKEGTTGGVIRGNRFDGTGISGQNSADSWVDAKGVGYLIENNTGTFAPPGTFANGYETHNPSTTPSFANGCGNVWRGNTSDLGGAGAYAIKITSVSKCTTDPNVVHSGNTVTHAGTGLTNVPVTP